MRISGFSAWVSPSHYFSGPHVTAQAQSTVHGEGSRAKDPCFEGDLHLCPAHPVPHPPPLDHCEGSAFLRFRGRWSQPPRRLGPASVGREGAVEDRGKRRGPRLQRTASGALRRSTGARPVAATANAPRLFGRAAGAEGAGGVRASLGCRHRQAC